jgi:hypothetical protein
LVTPVFVGDFETLVLELLPFVWVDPHDFFVFADEPEDFLLGAMAEVCSLMDDFQNCKRRVMNGTREVPGS